jgi:Zn-dependent protease with chaperone function
MIAPYALRLLCLCLASFFVVNAGVGLLVSAASHGAMRVAETMRARAAARFLYVLRILPFALGIGAVFGLCVPSYLWFEPHATPERVGLACLALVFFGAASWFVSVARVSRALLASSRSQQVWKETGHEDRLPGETSLATIVEKDAPLLALAGILQPRLIVSRGVLGALTGDQLDVALQHENAHRVSHDNLKRFFLLMVPGAIPFFHGLGALEEAWAKFAEWAADDEAVQGDSNRAVSLASALLRVARMGSGPRLSFLHTSLVAGDRDLAARVERLLQVEMASAEPHYQMRTLTFGAGFTMAALIATMLAGPAMLSSVHRLLELVLR